MPSDSSDPPEFVLGQVTVAQTVDITFNLDDFDPPHNIAKQIQLGQWMTDNEIDINHQRHIIPLALPDGTPFNAGSSLNPGAPSPEGLFFWKTREEFDFDCRDTRHHFAIANCNGCHNREADVGNFRHVNGRSTGSAATVSEFLSGVPATGLTVGTTDPTCPAPPEPGAVIRHFNDIRRRSLDLCALLDTLCPNGDGALDGDMDIFNTGFEGQTVH